MSTKTPPKTKEVGIQFPKGKDGNRSTTDAGKNVFAASMRAVDEEAAKAILNEKTWRHKYAKHVVQHVEKGASEPKAALSMAEAGLAYVHENFVFVRDGKEMSVNEAMRITDQKFNTGFIKGTAKKPTTFELEVPYGDKVLKGDELLVQIEKWVRNGTIEMSAGHAIAQVVRRREWLDLSGKYFVLLGALSAMGPLRVLLALGANIVAVDLNRPSVWSSLLDLADKSCGTITFPLSKCQKDIKDRTELMACAGCDLMGDTPEVKNWLLSLYTDKPLTVGSYAYLDGLNFVRLSVAMDAIVHELCTKRTNTSIAYLCTPTDCHVIPAPAYEAQVAAFKREAAWMSLLRLLSNGAWLTKNARRPVEAKDGSKVHIVDAIVVDQGPNYILAKRIQHWRAMIARQTHKCVVSTNVAPSTATASVISNRSFAWAYNGLHNFKPMEVFKQETSNAVMTALLLHDLSSPDSVANPSVPLANPLHLFADNSFHGGAWRTAHRFTSIGIPSALLYFLSVFIRIYLAVYNLLQTLGWSLALVSTVRFLAAPDNGTVWTQTGPIVTLFQFLALLEIVHAVLGIVSSAVLQTTIQIGSRLLLVGIASTNSITHPTPGLSLMLMCWCLTEVIRYGYFFAKLAGVEIAALTWLRYSLFIILYPAGVAGELMTATAALPTMHASLAAVNTLSAEPAIAMYVYMHRAVETHFFADVSDWIRYVVCPAYFLGLPFLYMHMLAQRKKILRLAAPAPGSKKQKKD